MSTETYYNKNKAPIYKIRAVHRHTGNTLMLYYKDIPTAQKHNKALKDFEYV